jgi:hypothetical protein
MGYWTELHLNVELKGDTPENVLDILRFMTKPNENSTPVELPDHPLFKTARWHWMLSCYSAYFSHRPASEVYVDTWEIKETGRSGKEPHLSVRSQFKNYDDEIKKFLDWLHPYVDCNMHPDNECVGYHRGEDHTHPTLIYCYFDRFNQVSVAELFK